MSATVQPHAHHAHRSNGLRGRRLEGAIGIALVGGLGSAWFLSAAIDGAMIGRSREADAAILVPMAIALTIGALVVLPFGRWGPRTAATLLIVIGVAGPVAAGELFPYVSFLPPYVEPPDAWIAIGMLACTLVLAFGAPLILGWTFPSARTRVATWADATLMTLAVVFLVTLAVLTQVAHSVESPNTLEDIFVALVASGAFLLGAALLSWIGFRTGRRTG
jgi:hypothetical protein